MDAFGETLITTAQAASMCRVDAITVRTWVVRHGLPIAEKVDGQSYYRVCDVVDVVRILRADRRRKVA